jgi:acetylornithine deacetylase/succinyl-diaminopimelate desuccinylase-like protein
LTAREAYAGRSNLVAVLPSGSPLETGIALNAHVDVIAPYVAPRVGARVVHGRGACDDKGSVVAIVAALQVVSSVLRESGARPRGNVVAMFAVEEETGGNGSLALALDGDLRRQYDRVLVLECASNRLYPANRGAVWYRTELAIPGMPPLEAAAFAIEEMELEGRAIRAESRHPLFPDRPAQTCHGMIGAWGEHPSRICGEVAFRLRARGPWTDDARDLLADCLAAGLAEYTGLYGDKTCVADPDTGEPKVARHYDIREQPDGVVIAVYGSTGHMGSVLENDGAITKMAALVRALVRSRPRLENAFGAFELVLERHAGGDPLVLEGGQGFVPTHSIDDVMERMREAARRGAARAMALRGLAAPAEGDVRTTYEKLHNAAFDGDPDSEAMRDAVAAMRDAGLEPPDPVTGWTVSCDARLFACENPGMPVLTSGPGHLSDAHSDHECLDLDALRQGVEFLSAFILRTVTDVPTTERKPQ